MALTTTYLLPAILLNPAFILHLINTFVSHTVPPSPAVVSHSPHPFIESIGPAPGTTPYLDMHADDGLCWRYTAIVVVVQVLAFGRVSDNRVQRRVRKAAKAERERSRREKLDGIEEGVDGKSSVVVNGGLDGAVKSVDENRDCQLELAPHDVMNGNNKSTYATMEISGKEIQLEGLETESEASLTEMSDEEMMI